MFAEEIMDEEKIFLNWNQQIDKLKSRNLVFGNKEEEKNAIFSLQNNSYYAIINGYKDIFCVKTKDGQDDYQNELFINLRDSYEFDKELSAIVFKYLLKIEDSLKAVFSYNVGNIHGHKESSYLIEEKYRLGEYRRNKEKYEREILLDKLSNEIDNNFNPQMIHYKQNYEYTPPWVLASCISLDTLLYWIKLSRTTIKSNTINTFLLNCNNYPFTHITVYEENAELFTNAFTIIKEYRNRAAHGNRIMNHVSKNNIKINLLELYAGNRKEIMAAYRQGSLNRDLMSLFVAITIMLSKRNTIRNLFISEVEAHFSNLEKDNEYLYSKVIEHIKLPTNFLELLRGII